jgi:hypothetical protein
MKATASFKLSKTTKRMLATMFKSTIERNAFKNIMISVELLESSRVKSGTKELPS